MASEFDPYRKWLGIPTEQRPVDHYLLLGLSRFESDQQKISAAADQRMAAIRKFQNGPRAAMTQRILNELSRAKLCLLDPHARLAYDEMLRGMDAADGDSSGHDGLSAVVIDRDREPPGPADHRTEREAPYYRRPWFPFFAAAAIGSVAVSVWLVGNYLRRPTPVAKELPSTPEPPEPAQPAESSDTTSRQTPQPPVRVEQEARGDVRLLPALAALQGESLELDSSGEADALVGWLSPNDTAFWEFQVYRLPRQKLFRVQLSYRSANAGFCILRLGNAELPIQLRAADRDVSDEHFISVTGTGTHRLSLRTRDAAALRLNSIVLSFP